MVRGEGGPPPLEAVPPGAVPPEPAAPPVPPAPTPPEQAELPELSPPLGGDQGVRGSRWHARVLRGDARSTTRAEVAELFQLVDPHGGEGEGSVSVTELRAAVAKACPPQTASFLEEILLAAGLPSSGRLEAEQFLQALRLGARDDVHVLAARLRGRDPLEAAGRIRRAPLTAYLRRRKEIRDNCLSLPFTLAFFALFFGLALWHFRQQEVFRLTEAVSLDLPLRSLEGSYPSSLWTWLDSRVGQPRLARYNLLVGGVHLAKAASGEKIDDVRVLCPYSVIDYVAGLSSSGAATPKLCQSAAGRLVDRTEWLLWPLQQQSASAATASVRSWWQLAAAVNSSSRSVVPASGPEDVEVSMLAYNANLDFYVFYRLKYHIPSSGATVLDIWATAFDAAPLWMKAREDWSKGGVRRWVMFFDVIFVLMYASLFLQGAWRLADSWRCSCRRRCSSCFCIWGAIDLAIELAAVLLTLKYFYNNNLTQGLLELINGLPVPDETQTYSLSALQQLASSSKQLSWSAYLLQLDAVVEQAARLGVGQKEARWYATVFAACLCLRFFRAFRANPRLNLVLQTMRRASSDFAHFGVVFAFLLLCFAFVGHALFGGQVEPFSTAGGAVHSTFLCLLGFLFDNYKEQLYESGGALAILWTLAFNFIMVLILLDVIAAIVFDAYTEVKMAAGETPSLWQQARNALGEVRCRRARKEDTSVNRADSMDVTGSLSHPRPRSWWRRQPLDARLLTALELQGRAEKDLLSVEDLCEQLGTHTWEEQVQVEALFARALKHSRCEQEAVSLSDAVRLCSRADANVRELEPLTRGLLERVQQWSSEREELMAALAARPVVERPSSAREVREPAWLPEKPRDHGQDPEPEPPSAALGSSQNLQFLEERLEKAAKAQAERYGRLEESIARLARRMEPMLHGGPSDTTVDPRRIQKLEEKVHRLTATLSPVLDLNQPWQPKREQQRSAMRPPTPPRALVGAAPDKLPRATTQGLGHGVLNSSSRSATPPRTTEQGGRQPGSVPLGTI